MDRRNLPTDDRAVSNVVGVVLMVAVTVALAATAGSFALGLAGETELPPSAAFSTDYDEGTSDRLVFEHTAGEALDAGRLSVVVTGAESAEGVPDGRYEGSTLADGEAVAAGDRLGLSSTALGVKYLDLRAASVRIAWTSADGGRSVVLARWDGPVA